MSLCYSLRFCCTLFAITYTSHSKMDVKNVPRVKAKSAGAIIPIKEMSASDCALFLDILKWKSVLCFGFDCLHRFLDCRAELHHWPGLWMPTGLFQLPIWNTDGSKHVTSPHHEQSLSSAHPNIVSRLGTSIHLRVWQQSLVRS